MDNVRGASRGGRGRGGGRGGARAPQGGNGTPLAAQMRQIQRLEEPKELSLLRKYKDLGATRIRSVYGLNGLLQQEVFVPFSVAKGQGYEDVPPGGDYITLLDAEGALADKSAREERERMLARRKDRLAEGRRALSIGSLTDEETRVLRMSQKEYNSFRAAGSSAAPPQSVETVVPKAPSPAAQAAGPATAGKASK